MNKREPDLPWTAALERAEEREVMKTVLIEIERAEGFYGVRVSDEYDYVPLEPQTTLAEAQSLADDMAELMNRLGVAAKFSRIGFDETESSLHTTAADWTSNADEDQQ